jgi:hypothetical protein
MSELWACLCCCFVEESTQVPPPNRQQQVQKKKKKAKPVRPARLITRYGKQDVAMVDDEDRHEKRVKAYCCPICTLYYTSTSGPTQEFWLAVTV